jgi:hypothetical protein
LEKILNEVLERWEDWRVECWITLHSTRDELEKYIREVNYGKSNNVQWKRSKNY